jgi:hypothetical protein
MIEESEFYSRKWQDFFSPTVFSVAQMEKMRASFVATQFKTSFLKE